MTCRQLGGACDLEFRGDTFEEIAEKSKNHGMAMFQQGDGPHLGAMNSMREKMDSPEAMNEWLEEKRREFDGLPEDD